MNTYKHPILFGKVGQRKTSCCRGLRILPHQAMGSDAEEQWEPFGRRLSKGRLLLPQSKEGPKLLSALVAGNKVPITSETVFAVL